MSASLSLVVKTGPAVRPARNYGRIEKRTYTVFHDVAWLQERHEWPGLRGVVMVESTREIGEKIERETRFYITSLVWLAVS